MPLRNEPTSHGEPTAFTTGAAGCAPCVVVRPSVVSAAARFEAFDPVDRARLERAAARLGLGSVRPSSEGLLGDGI